MITARLPKIDEDKVCRSLGIPVPQMNDQIRSCMETVRKTAQPRAVYRILPADEVSFDDNFDDKDAADAAPSSLLLPGRDIRRLLEDCSEVVVMALTLGSDLERCLMREEVTNMASAYILDVCASCAVEEAADDYEAQLRDRCREDGKYLTNRFSPGYGDLPLGVQRPLLTFLNAGRAIGLTLTPTDLMVPRKSITAVMGVCSREKPEVLGGCAHCPIRTKCSWREHGKRCYAPDAT